MHQKFVQNIFMLKTHELRDAFRFPFFTPTLRVRGVFGDPQAIIVDLVRRQKKRSAAPVDSAVVLGTTVAPSPFVIFPVEGEESTFALASDAYTVPAARP